MLQNCKRPINGIAKKIANLSQITVIAPRKVENSSKTTLSTSTDLTKLKFYNTGKDTTVTIYPEKNYSILIILSTGAVTALNCLFEKFDYNFFFLFAIFRILHFSFQVKEFFP